MKNPVSKGIGHLLEIQKHDEGITGRASDGIFRVLFYSDTIAKVSLSHDASFNDFSYAVISGPKKIDFELSEDEHIIRLSTKKFRVVIKKNPIRFRFETLEGHVLNEDDPGLGTAWIGDQVTTYKKLHDGERFIGLGEKTGALDRRGSSYQNWTSDAYGYHGGSDPLYCSTPFYIGILNRSIYGIFFDNSYKTFFNFGASNNRFASFSADAGPMNYYFIHDHSIDAIIQNYTDLTGRMEMPPLWSLGYQQCRYSYYPDKEVESVARTFREKEIPADVIVLDIHHMHKYKIFTWDPKNFPDPQKLLTTLKAQGFQVVVIFDPGIKIEPGYDAYDDGKDKDVFLKYPDGEYYSGQVWPGWCHFPDFTKSETRSWWASKMKPLAELGVAGFWNDMNEIATWGHALPDNIEFDFEGNKGTARMGRNLFGFQMARSTYEGARKMLKGKRPFNLTRSGYSGIQRYAAVWTGDNVSYDEHMLLGVRLVSSLGLTGVAFAGYDAGGFVGEANTKLFARWISIAALSPFFRGHTMINTRDSEPWSFGEEVEGIARNMIRFRYSLMPYIYSLFHLASESGRPIQRSLAIDFPFEPKVFDHAFHNQYLFGPSILVAPVESTKDVVKVYFPHGEWHDLYTGKLYHGNQEVFIESPIHKLPVFIKGGSVIPMRSAGINTASPDDVLQLHAYAGSSSSEFLLYQDDGETYDYQQGAQLKRIISFDPSGRHVRCGESKGPFRAGFRKIKLFFHGFEQLGGVRLNGHAIDIHATSHSFFAPLEKYDPINEPDSMGSENVQVAEFDYGDHEITISW